RWCAASPSAWAPIGWRSCATASPTSGSSTTTISASSGSSRSEQPAMCIPLSWLAEFVTWSGPAAALAERLTMAGLKIEAIEEVGQLDRRIVAGRLAAVEPHPEADRVQVCRVEVGRPAPLVAVSGAPGLAAGQMVPVALPGARLPDGGEAQAVRIRGVESAGVLCSEAELALGEDASQVLVLADDTAPGTPLAALPGIADTVL